MSAGGGPSGGPVSDALAAAALLLQRRDARMRAEERNLEQGGRDLPLLRAEAAEDTAAKLLDAALKRVRRCGGADA